jgi:ribose/xylose/arabinose/galactoside ABC-type transport system permease subunit
MARAAAEPLKSARWREFGALIVFVAFFTILSLALGPKFFSLTNFQNILNQNMTIALLAVGSTFVILTAGIDLSVGSVLALSGVVLGWVMARLLEGGMSPLAVAVAAIAAGLSTGLICGLTSGVLVARFRLPPFVATLGLMAVGRGLTRVVTRGMTFSQQPEVFHRLGQGLPPVALVLLVFVGAWLTLRYTRFGRFVLATGSNEKAARLSGVNVAGVKIMVYALSGLLAGLGGVLLTSRLQSANALLGLGYELNAIAAVVIGGTSLMGGKGSIPGTLLGVFIYGMIQNCLNLFGVDPFWQEVVIGAVVIAVVLLDYQLQPKPA